MSKKELHEYLEIPLNFSDAKVIVESNFDYLEKIYHLSECPSGKRGSVWRKIWHEYAKPRESSPLAYYMSMKLNETEQHYFKALQGNSLETKIVEKLTTNLEEEKELRKEAENRLNDRQNIPENAYISDIRLLLKELKDKTGLEFDSLDLLSRRYLNKFQNDRSEENNKI